MREFLFRGKRVVNGKWVEGFMYSQHFPLEFRDDFYIRCYDTDYLVIPETVGQYTGLTDKNGVRIFEGDIVECVSDGERAVISWLKYSACFGLSFDGWCCDFDNYDYNLPSDFEVIGNIHDNPEILKTPSL